jgi:hypothetical protein
MAGANLNSAPTKQGKWLEPGFVLELLKQEKWLEPS